MLSKESDDFEKSKVLLKVFYDGVKLATAYTETAEASLKTLPELIIEDFDEEQVWAGIELQNKFALENCRTKLDRLNSLPNFLLDPNEFSAPADADETLDVEPDFDQAENQDSNDEAIEDSDDNVSLLSGEKEEESDIENDNDVDKDEDIFNDPDFQHMSDSDLDDKLPLFDKDDTDEEESNSEEDEKEQNEMEEKETELENKTSDYMTNALKAMKSNQESVEEDQFFKLDEMENFLDAEDAKAMKDTEDNEAEDNDDGIDYFASDMDEDDTETPNLMYKDLFDPISQEAAISESGPTKTLQPTQLPNNDLLESDDNAENSEDEELGEMKSAHELRTLRLQKKIQQIETEAVKDKPWQMTGEVAAIERPENALLEEHLDYETVSKQAPIITEEVSKRLEDIIKQRIKDQAWDDVERKVKPVENPYDYKKKLILDQEKSKLSLAQVYEEEYLKQKGDLEDSKKTAGMLDEEEEDKPETLDEIKKKMNSLFSKLDTLTHYHYTPQAAHADVKVIRNLPTISMEEVAPVAMSDATLLAPQEIADKKKGEDIGSSERTITDKKRDLRLKKTKQRKIQKAKEQKQKLVDKLNPNGLATKHSKKAALKAIEQAEKEGKVKTIKDKNKGIKSSKAFFDKMQNEVQGIVSDIRAEKSKKKNKNINVAALKL